MKRTLFCVTLCSLLAAVGCEKKEGAPASAADALKAAGDKAGTAVKDAAKTTADAASTAVDKTKEAAASGLNTAADKANEMLATEVRTLSDKIGTMIAQLKSGGATVSAAQKPAFDAEVAALEGQHKTFAQQVSSTGSESAEALTKQFSALKDQGNKILDGIKAAAAKYNITLS